MVNYPSVERKLWVGPLAWSDQRVFLVYRLWLIREYLKWKKLSIRWTQLYKNTCKNIYVLYFPSVNICSEVWLMGTPTMQEYICLFFLSQNFWIWSYLIFNQKSPLWVCLPWLIFLCRSVHKIKFMNLKDGRKKKKSLKTKSPSSKGYILGVWVIV